MIFGPPYGLDLAAPSSEHCENIHRTVSVVNLDPAAEHFSYPVSVDIRELVDLDDVMEADFF